jgi:hypothetical protein
MIDQGLSLFIPRVFTNISKDTIRRLFEDYEFGGVNQIDFVERIDGSGKKYHNVFIHFEYWCENIVVQHFQERVRDPNREARFVYNDPWYWTVLENKAYKKPMRVNPKPTIMLGEEDEETVLDVSDTEDELEELNTGFIEEDAINSMHCCPDPDDDNTLVPNEDSEYEIPEPDFDLVHLDYVVTLERELEKARITIAQLTTKSRAMEEELWTKFRPIDEDEESTYLTKSRGNMKPIVPALRGDILVSRYGSVAPDLNDDISSVFSLDSDYDYGAEMGV